MNPDVAIAVDDLRRRGLLTEAHAALPRRVARGELISVRGELGWLLYAGVSLVAVGAGLLVEQNLTAIGPFGIVLGIGAVAFLSLAWVARTAPPFSWGEVPSPSLVFDYLLLLGLLLTGADLAFIELKFTPLGPEWPWHFFIVSLVAFAFAVRYDSRIALSLALSSFAAWRGVSVAYLEPGWWWASEEAVRVNMILCGLVFVGLGTLFVRTRRKGHFEPVATHMGWLLVLGALFAGECQSDRRAGLSYAAMLLAIGGGLVWWALRGGRFWLFAMGVVGGYAGLCGFVLRGLGRSIDSVFVFGWFAFSSLGVLTTLVIGHRAMRRKP